MAIAYSSLVGGGGSWPPVLFSPQPNPIQAGANALHKLTQVATAVDITTGLTQVWSYSVPAGTVAIMLQGRLRNVNTTSNIVDFEVEVDGEVVFYDDGTTSTAADFYVFGAATSQPANTAPFQVKSNITVRANKALSTSVNFEAAWYLVKA